jgi:hypothetical protein
VVNGWMDGWERDGQTTRSGEESAMSNHLTVPHWTGTGGLEGRDFVVAYTAYNRLNHKS